MAQELVFSRINLAKTNYSTLPNCRVIEYPDIDQLNDIYKKYCQYKKFTSVRPIFKNEYWDENSEIIGYTHNNLVVAFTLIKILDNLNVESVQFAWDYKNPKLELGLNSLKHECAYYKSRGYQYLHLGNADHYKTKLDGFEILGRTL